MGKETRYSLEVRERAVRLVEEQEKTAESQWAGIGSIAAKIGYTAETLMRWVRQKERDTGIREGLTTAEREELKRLQRENRERKKVNEILRLAAAYFAKGSSTANRNDGCLHRGSSRRIGSRADLSYDADHSLDLL